MKNSGKLLMGISDKTKSIERKLDILGNILDKYWEMLQRLEKAFLGLSFVVFLIILWPSFSKYISTMKNLYERSTPDFRLNLIFVVPLTSIITLLINGLIKRGSNKHKK